MHNDKVLIAILLPVSDKDKMLKYILTYHSLRYTTLHKCVYHKMETAQWQSNYSNTITSCNGSWLNAEVHYSSLRFMINKNAQMCLS